MIPTTNPSAETGEAHNAHILETGTNSYRLRSTRTRTGRAKAG